MASGPLTVTVTAHAHPGHVLTVKGDGRQLVANCSCHAFGYASTPGDPHQLANFWEAHLDG